MLYALLKTLHVLGVIVWIGGMLFAHFFLRPAVAALEPPLRLRLMHDVLGRFFQAVVLASLVVLASGVWMLVRVAATAGFVMPLAWTVMAVLGLSMVVVFLFIRVVPYPRMTRALALPDLPAAAAALAVIRRWVLVNLALGIVILLVTLLHRA